MVISSNGNVIICYRDWKEQNVIGNFMITHYMRYGTLIK